MTAPNTGFIGRTRAWIARTCGADPSRGPLNPRDLQDLKSKERVVRDSAIRRLAASHNPRAVDALEPLLADPGVDVVAWALARLGDPRAVPALLAVDEHCKKGARDASGHVHDRKLHDCITTALEEIGVPAVPALIHALQSTDDHQQEVAATVLGRIGDRKAVEPLLKSMEEGSVAAGHALAQMGETAATGTLQRHLMDSYLAWPVREAAARDLAQLGWRPPDQEQRAVLLTLLGHFEEAAALGPHAVGPLLEALRQGPAQEPEQEALACALLRLHAQGVLSLDALGETLHSRHARTLLVASGVLRQLGGQQANHLLAELLVRIGDETEEDRARHDNEDAARAAHRGARARTLAEVSAYLAECSDPSVVVVLRGACGKHYVERALEDLLARSAPRVEEADLRAIAVVPDTRVVVQIASADSPDGERKEVERSHAKLRQLALQELGRREPAA